MIPYTWQPFGEASENFLVVRALLEMGRETPPEDDELACPTLGCAAMGEDDIPCGRIAYGGHATTC